MSYTIDSSIRAKYYGGKRSTSSIKYIVLHYTANSTTPSGKTATARGNANYFKNIDRKASAHYICDRKNIIYSCVPDNYIAYSVGDNQIKRAGGGTFKGKCKNSNSISIEMVSETDKAGNYFIPEATQKHAAELTRNLMKKYNISISNVIRHADVTYKDCPRPMSPYTASGRKNWTKMLQLIQGKVKEVEEEEVTQEQFNKMFDNYIAELAKKEPSNWSADARKWAESNGYIVGNAKGEKQYKKYPTREELIQLLFKIYSK